MGIPPTLQKYLDEKGVHYEIMCHSHTGGSMETAQAAHIPGDQLVKGVILEDEQGYLMAMVPATYQVGLGKLHKHLNRQLGLATEPELTELFHDCEPGAVPPLGQAYGVAQIMDESLVDCGDVYFEAGNHTDVVHISGSDFRALMADTPHYLFAHNA